MMSNCSQDVQDTRILLENQFAWIRSSFAEPYYKFDSTKNATIATTKLISIQDKFDQELVQRADHVKATKTPFKFPPRKPNFHSIKHCTHHHSSCSSSEDFSDLDDELENDDSAFEELERKKTHPWRLHDELWYNDKGEMNDGPVCRCSAKARRTGIRHGIYPGEDKLPKCDPNTDNRDRLYHYRIVIKPLTNFTTKFPTIITYDNHQYMFIGFSILSHKPIHKNYPSCKLIRFNIEYEMSLEEEKFPSNFTIRDLDLFHKYVFKEILELEDLNWFAFGDDETNACPRVHLYPRFARVVEDDGEEFLSMHVILNYLLNQSKPLIDDTKIDYYKNLTDSEWVDFAKQHKGMIVTYPGMKPSSIRVDQIDRDFDELSEMNNATTLSSSSSSITINDNNNETKKETTFDKDYPIIVHFGIRPPQLSYAGNPKYQKTWRDYVKYRHLLANKPKVAYEEKQMLLKKEEKLQEMRSKSDLKRDCTVVISSKGFYCTGIYCDLIQYCLMIPVLVCHLRFHDSLIYLEDHILNYKFNDRYLLQLALTHPSYRENFGMNADHARNALTNCGIRQPYYGDRKVHFTNTRKRGINMLINIMSRFGHNQETTSSINHNERLEFLGDAVVEFLTSIHLYHIFPDLEEGGLATYRAAIVQNQHLAVMAKNLQLNKYMLYAHGSDLCHDLELKHAMANCFEALIGALFLDGGIDIADRVFSETLFYKPHMCLKNVAQTDTTTTSSDQHHETSDSNSNGRTTQNCCSTVVVAANHQDDHLLDEKIVQENLILRDLWINYNKHPIQMQHPNGDRFLIEKIPRLKELHEFEQITGIEFTHIRLLARAFTHRSVGFNNLTLGSNQRMEFLGDTVLQLIASEYLYKFFPEHHEGHLSLLRSSLVNNKTQAVVCDDLGMTRFAIYNYAKGELKTKDRADLLEAFLGALYVDKGLDYCKKFCETCFFPRLEHFIMNQDWNDPKSKLQQCCLTLRSFEGGEPDIPVYKVIESLGPTNTRIYKVAVYFRDKRLETGTGHSIQEAEMDAASAALKAAKELFPQLNHQKRIIERSITSTVKQDDNSQSNSPKKNAPKTKSERRKSNQEQSNNERSSRSPESLSSDKSQSMDTIEYNGAFGSLFSGSQDDSNSSNNYLFNSGSGGGGGATSSCNNKMIIASRPSNKSTTTANESSNNKTTVFANKSKINYKTSSPSSSSSSSLKTKSSSSQSSSPFNSTARNQFGNNNKNNSNNNKSSSQPLNDYEIHQIYNRNINLNNQHHINESRSNINKDSK